MAIKLPSQNSQLPTKYGRIGVLMGGPSTEREISLRSGRTVYENLKQFGLEAVAIDIKTDNIEENISLIKSHHLNCAFLALHGRFGEDGQIQELLAALKIPYTGSGVRASRLAMDKIVSHNIFASSGLNVPRYEARDRNSHNTKGKIQNNLPLPWVVKPATHGSSIGLSIVDKVEYLEEALDLAFSFDERVLIEEFIRGRELTVGILENMALPIIEIIPKKRFFDYEAKYQPGMTEYLVPAKLEKEVQRKVTEAALSSHKLLGCSGCSRVDMILGEKNIPFILEVNTIPGLTETSLLPKAAKCVGISFRELCLKLIKLAYEKAQDN